jgi:hypothetical protein
MNIFENVIIVGSILALNDVISMGMTKEIVLGNVSSNLIYIPVILYGIQMLIFYNGIKFVSMTTLNLTWNLCSNIVITLLGLYYFKENISHLEIFGLLFGLFALLLFGIAQYGNN